MGTGDDVQVSGSDVATLWERELGSDRCDAEGDGGVPPLDGSEDIRNSILASWGGRMGVVIGGGGLGGGVDVASEGVNLEAEGYHCRIYCESPHLQNMHGGLIIHLEYSKDVYI